MKKTSLKIKLIMWLITAMFCSSAFLVGCTKDSSSIRDSVLGSSAPIVETYNNKPINDENDLDKVNAINVLPEEKLYAKYNYKISYIGVFNHNDYLSDKDHAADAVITYKHPDGYRVVRIYSNNPIPDKKYF